MNYNLSLPKEIVSKIRQDKISRGELSEAIANYISQRERSAMASGIDLQPADNGKHRNQGGWLHLFNERDVAMVSAPDLYRVGQSGPKELIESLRDDFKTFFVTSTTVSSRLPGTEKAKVTHNIGSTVVKPTEIIVAIPILKYYNTSLSKLFNTPGGLQYVQALFNTQDSAEKIAQGVYGLSGVSLDNVIVKAFPKHAWSFFRDHQKYDLSDIPVGFGFRYRGNFAIANSWERNRQSGRSRGISVK